MTKLRVLDLFAGIGGFSLGLERTGGFETVAFCEIEEFPRRVLAKHWPEVPCYHDVRELTADVLRRDGISVDVICGGFPCQDISAAGKQAGIEGERSGLWSEIVRLVRELRPQFLLVENVPNLLNLGLNRVLGDLAEIGFDAEWEVRGADSLGATQHRERIWILAYSNNAGCEGPIWAGKPHQARPEWETAHSESLRSARGYWPPGPRSVNDIPRMADGSANRAHRLRALGNSIVPQIPEIIGRAILEAERAAA